MSGSRSVPANRRQVLAAMAMGGSGLALGLAAASQSAHAQELTDYSSHPLTGMWLAMANPALPENPQFPAPSLYTANGYVILQFPPIDVGATGPIVQSILLGVWEPYDEQTGHFTAVQSLSAIDGTLIGSVTIDGFPQVQKDNMTFIDDFTLTYVTIRDANGAILQEIPPGASGRPVTGTRMMVGAPGFSETVSEATPVEGA